MSIWPVRQVLDHLAAGLLGLGVDDELVGLGCWRAGPGAASRSAGGVPAMTPIRASCGRAVEVAEAVGLALPWTST